MNIASRTPEIAPVKNGVLLFRSCLISTEYPGAEAATKWLFERFGIEYTVHPEQTCCTGLGYYSELVPGGHLGGPGRAQRLRRRRRRPPRA